MDEGGSDKKASQRQLKVNQLLRESGWAPNGIKPSQQPKIVEDVDTFLHEAFYGNHMNEVIVFPNGIEKLQLADDIPEFLSHIPESTTVQEVLDNMDAKDLEKLDARVYYMSRGRMREQKSTDCNGKEMETLDSKRNELYRVEAKGYTHKSMYLTEFRYTRHHKYRPTSGSDWTRTILKSDLPDYLPRVQIMPYVDHYNEGCFLGGKHTGSSLHIDQCLWSNIGKNFYGYKLMAVWPYDVKTSQNLDPHFRQLFDPPLSEEEEELMATACKLVVISPGDVCLFSGANPHMVMVLSDELSFTAYESFVNLNLDHINVLCNSNQDPEHVEEFHMDPKTLEDIKWDIVDNMNDNLDLMDSDEKHFPQTDEAALLAVCETLQNRDPFMRKNLHPHHPSKRLRTGSMSASSEEAAEHSCDTTPDEEN